MAHKVHPKAYRIKRNDDWDSRWFHKEPAELLEEDFNIRKFLDEKLAKIGIEKIEIERFSNKLNIIIITARPGLIIGRGGEGVELLKKQIESKILKKNKESGKPQEIKIEIRELKNPWAHAFSSATWIAQQIERRMPHKKVLKQGLQKISTSKGVQGARVEISGRLGGAEMSRREWLGAGQLPLQTIRADIDYAKTTARTTYGAIGVKVWIYKGEKFE